MQAIPTINYSLMAFVCVCAQVAQGENMTVGSVGNRIIRRCVGQKKPDYFSNLQIRRNSNKNGQRRLRFVRFFFLVCDS